MQPDLPGWTTKRERSQSSGIASEDMANQVDELQDNTPNPPARPAMNKRKDVPSPSRDAPNKRPRGSPGNASPKRKDEESRWPKDKIQRPPQQPTGGPSRSTPPPMRPESSSESGTRQKPPIRGATGRPSRPTSSGPPKKSSNTQAGPSSSATGGQRPQTAREESSAGPSRNVITPSPQAQSQADAPRRPGQASTPRPNAVRPLEGVPHPPSAPRHPSSHASQSRPPSAQARPSSTQPRPPSTPALPSNTQPRSQSSSSAGLSSNMQIRGSAQAMHIKPSETIDITESDDELSPSAPLPKLQVARPSQPVDGDSDGSEVQFIEGPSSASQSRPPRNNVPTRKILKPIERRFPPSAGKSIPNTGQRASEPINLISDSSDSDSHESSRPRKTPAKPQKASAPRRASKASKETTKHEVISLTSDSDEPLASQHVGLPTSKSLPTFQAPQMTTAPSKPTAPLVISLDSQQCSSPIERNSALDLPKVVSDAEMDVEMNKGKNVDVEMGSSTPLPDMQRGETSVPKLATPSSKPTELDSALTSSNWVPTGLLSMSISSTSEVLPRTKPPQDPLPPPQPARIQQVAMSVSTSHAPKPTSAVDTPKDASSARNNEVQSSADIVVDENENDILERPSSEGGMRPKSSLMRPQSRPPDEPSKSQPQSRGAMDGSNQLELPGGSSTLSLAKLAISTPDPSKDVNTPSTRSGPVPVNSSPTRPGSSFASPSSPTLLNSNAPPTSMPSTSASQPSQISAPRQSRPVPPTTSNHIKPPAALAPALVIPRLDLRSPAIPTIQPRLASQHQAGLSSSASQAPKNIRSPPSSPTTRAVASSQPQDVQFQGQSSQGTSGPASQNARPALPSSFFARKKNRSSMGDLPSASSQSLQTLPQASEHVPTRPLVLGWQPDLASSEIIGALSLEMNNASTRGLSSSQLAPKPSYISTQPVPPVMQPTSTAAEAPLLQMPASNRPSSVQIPPVSGHAVPAAQLPPRSVPPSTQSAGASHARKPPTPNPLPSRAADSASPFKGRTGTKPILPQLVGKAPVTPVPAPSGSPAGSLGASSQTATPALHPEIPSAALPSPIPKPSISTHAAVSARTPDPVKTSFQPDTLAPSGTVGSTSAPHSKHTSSSKEIAPYLYREDKEEPDDNDPAAVYNRCVQANADLLADKAPLKQGWRPNPKRSEAYLDGYTGEVRENLKARREKVRRNVTFKDGIMCFTAEREIALREAKNDVAVSPPFPNPGPSKSSKPVVVRASSDLDTDKTDDMEVETALRSVGGPENSGSTASREKWKGMAKDIKTNDLQSNGAASFDQACAQPISSNGQTPPVVSTAAAKGPSMKTSTNVLDRRVDHKLAEKKSTLRLTTDPDVQDSSSSEREDDLTSLSDSSLSSDDGPQPATLNARTKAQNSDGKTEGTYDDKERPSGLCSRPPTPDWRPPPRVHGKPQYLGGAMVYDWEDQRHFMRATHPEHNRMEHLSSRLHDHVATFTPWLKQHKQMQNLHLAEMLVNAGEEDISFENNVDAESAPPVEFYYTNELVPSGADVPSPSLSDVNCCDCLIPCKENPHCACKSHQKQKFEDDRAIQLLIDKDEGAQAQWKNTKYPTNTGFLYKENGTLIELLPVYECNALCRCNEDCVNRRSQRPRGFPLTIFKTAERGWGVRYDGKTTLPGHSFIGIYAGEVLTENEADQRGRTYDRSNRTYLYNLDSAHLRTACEKINGRPFNEEEDECCKYVMDAHHVGNFTRFFNHCCQPNLVVVPLYVDNVNPFIYKTAFFTWRDVQPGEELTFNYGPGITGNEEGIAGNTGKFALCKCGARSCKGRMFC